MCFFHAVDIVRMLDECEKGVVKEVSDYCKILVVKSTFCKFTN